MRRGFTLIEMLTVIIIIGIASATIFTMLYLLLHNSLVNTPLSQAEDIKKLLLWSSTYDALYPYKYSTAAKQDGNTVTYYFLSNSNVSSFAEAANLSSEQMVVSSTHAIYDGKQLPIYPWVETFQIKLGNNVITASVNGDVEVAVGKMSPPYPVFSACYTATTQTSRTIKLIFMQPITLTSPEPFDIYCGIMHVNVYAATQKEQNIVEISMPTSSMTPFSCTLIPKKDDSIKTIENKTFEDMYNDLQYVPAISVNGRCSQ